MDAWEDITAGRFQEAVAAYSALLRERASPPDYCNRGIAYLNLGLLEHARHDFEAAEQSRGLRARSDAYLQWVGTAQWLAGEEREAAHTWGELVAATGRGQIGYSDAAGGVGNACLLWFAAVRLGDAGLLGPARRLLRGQAKKRCISSWPGPIAPFLLGRQAEPDRLLERVTTVPALRERELCQAEFYVAVRALASGQPAEWERGLRRAAEVRGALLAKEYYLATHESRRLSEGSGA